MPLIDDGAVHANQHRCDVPYVSHGGFKTYSGPAIYTGGVNPKLIGLGAKWQCGVCPKVYVLVQARPGYDSYKWKLIDDATAELDEIAKLGQPKTISLPVVRRRWWHKR